MTLHGLHTFRQFCDPQLIRCYLIYFEYNLDSEIDQPIISSRENSMS